MSGKGHFEECWTPIYPTADEGDTMERQTFGPPEPIDLPRNIALFLEDRVDIGAGARHPLSQAFWEKLLAAGEMHDRKQADYGRDDDPFYNIKQSAHWGVEPWQGAMMRADDKMGRIRNLAANGGELVNESIEDSLMDIAVYALIALVLRDEEATRLAHVTALRGT